MDFSHKNEGSIYGTKVAGQSLQNIEALKRHCSPQSLSQVTVQQIELVWKQR